eukprot:6210503-Pleurochrysis_carterae.AAC.4
MSSAADVDNGVAGKIGIGAPGGTATERVPAHAKSLTTADSAATQQPQLASVPLRLKFRALFFSALPKHVC